MTFPNPGPASQSTGNVAGGPYAAFSGTNSSQIIGPAGVLVNLGGGVGGGVALYDGANSITSGTAQFSNANGISFGFNGQTVTASVVPASSQTVQTQASGAIAGSGFTTATTAGTAIVGTNNSSGLSLGIPVYLTTAAAAATAISSIADSAHTQTVGMLSFANSNGITFGLSTGAVTGTITASAATAAPGISGIADSANTQTVGTLSFANSNGVSFGISTGVNTATLTASVNFAGLLSIINVSAGTTSNNLSAVTFANSNGISFGLNSSTITASYTVPATTGFAGTNSSFAGTNVSGSITLNTSGLSLALSAANPAAGNPTTVSWFQNFPIEGGLVISGAGASFTQTASVALQPILVPTPLSFYRMLALESFSTAASIISYPRFVSAGQGSTTASGTIGSSFTVGLFSRVSTGTNVNSSNIVSFSSTSWTRSYGVTASYSNATAVSTASATVCTSWVLGWQNNNIGSAGAVTSGSTSASGSSSASATTNQASTITTTALYSSQIQYMGGPARFLDIPLPGSLSPGEYWVGLQMSTATQTAGFLSGGPSMVSSTQAIGGNSALPTIIYNYGASQNTVNATWAQQGLGANLNTNATGAAFALSNATSTQVGNTWYAFLAQTK